MTERATSIALSYVIMLGITAILISGLLIAGSSFVGDQHDQVVQQELTVIGHQMVDDIERSDRLVEAADSDSPTVKINKSYPESVTGSTYLVTLEDDEEPRLVLESHDPEIVVEVQIANTTAVEQSQIGGGDIAIEYDTTEEQLVIRDV